VKQNLGLRDILDKVRAATRRMRQGRRTMEQLPYFGDAISHQAKLMEYPARMALPAMAACDSIRRRHVAQLNCFLTMTSPSPVAGANLCHGATGKDPG
jgi:hypothetical protein